MNRARPVVVTLVAGFVVAGAVTGAEAWFGGRGAGAGRSSTGVAQPVVLSPGTPGSALYPGGSASVELRAANPNPGPVRIAALALDPTRGTAGLAVDATHPACSTSGITLTPSDNGGAGWTVPGSGSLTISLAGALAADATFANACQGATLTVFLKVP